MVSLFIGLLLVILGNKNAYCLSFGLIVLGFSIGFYAFIKIGSINEAINQLEAELQEVDLENKYLMKEITKQQAKLKKQRTSLSIAFYACAVMLIVLGFVNMF